MEEDPISNRPFWASFISPVAVEVVGKLSDAGQDVFSSVYGTLISRIAERQWSEFLATMQSGNPAEFSDALWLRSDGLICGSLGHGKEVLPFQRVISYTVRDGEITLTYQTDNAKSKKCSLGAVSTTANMHVLKAFLDHVVEVNQKGKTWRLPTMRLS